MSTGNKYWDCFSKESAKHTILGYEFYIDTRNTKPVFCRKPQYGPYKYKIILEQVQTLIKNVWIEKCGEPWGSRIVWAGNLHQEYIQNIDDFIWRMCVSYTKLNDITKTFEFPIPRCDDAIRNIGAVSNKIRIISLDARQGYHQISVFHVYR